MDSSEALVITPTQSDVGVQLNLVYFSVEESKPEKTTPKKNKRSGGNLKDVPEKVSEYMQEAGHGKGRAKSVTSAALQPAISLPTQDGQPLKLV